MPNIIVDYEAIPAQSKQMRATGEQLNSEFTKIYRNIAEMHNSWYGKRYNELVVAFNNMIPQVNEILTLVVSEIPYTLEIVANNYSKADRGQNVTTAVKEPIKRINNVFVPNDVGMKFVTENVSALKNNISTSLKNAKEQMKMIDTQFAKLDWKSDAAMAFKTQFVKLKDEVISSFDNIEIHFTKLMNQTIQDMQATENANTVQ